ncbi:MAG: sphingomyelin synthase family protein [Bacteroidetes bacterium]|nr:sphingomyelin synthase family protein [Bacteroidota bacterium]
MTQSIVPNLNNVKNIWSKYLTKPGQKFSFIYGLIYLVVVLIILPIFLQFIEQRTGAILNDPILELFNPLDLTWLTFALIYGCLIIAVLYLFEKPELLRAAIFTYSITVTFRIVVMYLLPLEPPAQMIPLNDPFVQFFGSGEILTKDLFFSGHTSTLFILFLITESKPLKNIFLTATVLVAIFVVLQHVHYTVDVIAAPFFAYTAFRIFKVIQNNSKG